MSRTWHHVGFNSAAQDLLKAAIKTEVIGMEDVWYECGPDLEKYMFADGRVLYSYVQASPWASGPHTFMALRNDKEVPLHETLWTENEMEQYL